MADQNQILQQLGGNKFIAMTGARNFIKIPEGVKFRIMKAKDGINSIVIKLNDKDLYDILFMKDFIKTISKADDVYGDQLQSTFTENTGLDTHL